MYIYIYVYRCCEFNISISHSTGVIQSCVGPATFEPCLPEVSQQQPMHHPWTFFLSKAQRGFVRHARAWEEKCAQGAILRSHRCGLLVILFGNLWINNQILRCGQITIGDSSPYLCWALNPQYVYIYKCIYVNIYISIYVYM